MPNNEQSFEKKIEQSVILMDGENLRTYEHKNLETDEGCVFDSLTICVKGRGDIISIMGSDLARIQAVIANIHPAYRINAIHAHYWKGKNELEIQFTRDLK